MRGILLVLVALLSYTLAQLPSSKPHIIYILADDLGYGDVGFHNSTIPTPTLDGLARNGITLENYYVQPTCTPSRAALHTGRYPIRYGLQSGVLGWDQPYGLNLDEVTLPQRLRDAGYATHLVGKWNLGHCAWQYTPRSRGYDSFYGCYGPAQDHYTHSFNGGYDFRFNEDVDHSVNGRYSTAILAERVQSILQEYEVKQDSEKKPLFILLSLLAPHSPMQAPKKYVDMIPSHAAKTDGRRLYEASVAAIDEAVANVTAALQVRDMWDDTLLIFSADNGGVPEQSREPGPRGGAGINWPLRGGKFTLYEGGVRAVGLVSGPVVPPSVRGTVSRHLFHMTDWFPTLTGLAGMHQHDAAKPLDGVDQWGALLGGVSARSEVLLSIDTIGKAAALRQSNWKIITGSQNYHFWYPPPGLHGGMALSTKADEDTFSIPAYPDVPHVSSTSSFPSSGVRLYDVEADPHEEHDLSATHPDIVERMLARLQTYNATVVPPLVRPGDFAARPQFWDGIWTPWLEHC